MKGLPEAMVKMAYKAGAGAINWYPGHMASASRTIRDRLKLIDFILEVRDARIPLSSANEDFQDILSRKRRLLILNKADLANPNLIVKWKEYFNSINQRVVFVNAHKKDSVKLMLNDVRSQLVGILEKRPTLLIMVVGIPNVGKSALINSMHVLGHSSSSQEKLKKATVGPLPGVTQDLAGFKIGNQPSIYVLDTPGVLVPNIRDIDTGLKLALTGAVKDSVVGEDRLAQYLLAMLNGRAAPLRWKKDPNAMKPSKLDELRDKAKRVTKDVLPTPEMLLDLKRLAVLERKIAKRKYKKVITTDHNKDDVVDAVCEVLASTFQGFQGKLEEESDMESLVELQMVELRKVFKVPSQLGDAGRILASKKLLNLYRTGKLGHFSLDVIPGEGD